MNRIDSKNVINKLQYQQHINKKKKNQGISFDKLLEQKSNSLEKELKFSKHAKERIESRNLKLNEEDIEKISQAMNKAKEKGINNSLIVTDKAVYIANINSRTIITAMEGMKDRVFTNVDGVINI